MVWVGRAVKNEKISFKTARHSVPLTKTKEQPCLFEMLWLSIAYNLQNELTSNNAPYWDKTRTPMKNNQVKFDMMKTTWLPL